jgi:serine/threonine kinase PknH
VDKVVFRRYRLLSVIVVILAAAGITGYLLRPHWPASQTPTAQPAAFPAPNPSGPVTPLAASALEGLLLGPNQINTAMGAAGMTASAPSTVMDNKGAGDLSDKACLPLASAAEATVYAGSGWNAMRSQGVNDPQDHRVDQSVVLFSSAHDAGAFFTASAQSWPACSNRQFTETLASRRHFVFTVGPVSNTNGTLSATETGESAAGWTCQRALTVADNVAIDVTACSHSQSDSAVNIAHQIAAKVLTR